MESASGLIQYKFKLEILYRKTKTTDESLEHLPSFITHNWFLFNTFGLCSFHQLSANYLLFLIYKNGHSRYNFFTYDDLLSWFIDLSA